MAPAHSLHSAQTAQVLSAAGRHPRNDHVRRGHFFGSAYEIPAEDDAFDSALCTAVLEHLEEPESAIRECHRVLKPGACAVYTVPFIWHLHEEPRDFFRYSRYGLEYLFKKVGFEIVELEALSGFWVIPLPSAAVERHNPPQRSGLCR